MIWSSSTRGNDRASARWRAMVVLPDPDVPKTTMRTAVAIARGARCCHRSNPTIACHDQSCPVKPAAVVPFSVKLAAMLGNVARRCASAPRSAARTARTLEATAGRFSKPSLKD